MLHPMMAMKGSRLAYVIVPIKDDLVRVKYKMERVQIGETVDGKPRYSHKLVPKQVKVPGGFMVYFPKGHALRMTSEEIRRYNLQNTPKIVNLQGLHDPKSPVGRMMMSQDQNQRAQGFKDLEQLGIRLATARTGPNIVTKEQPLPNVEVDNGDGYVDLAAGEKLKSEQAAQRGVK